MFCSCCGSAIEANASFCANCGARVNKGAVQTNLHTESTRTVELKCNSCGASLDVPQSISGVVVCPYCNTKCVIERTVTDKSASQNSSTEEALCLPFSSSATKLHRLLIDFFVKNKHIPNDIFECAEVIREEHCFVPVYIFNCNGSEAFTYDIKNIRTYKTAVKDGDDVHMQNVDYEEWDNGNSSTASVRASVIATGCYSFERVVPSLYERINTSHLCKVSDAVLPADTRKLYDATPMPTVFERYVVPAVENELKSKAYDILSGQSFRNLRMCGANIQKDITKLYLGIYKIIYKYKEKEYEFFVSHDGLRVYTENAPYSDALDDLIKKKKEQCTREKSSLVMPNTSGYTVGRTLSLAVGIPFVLIAGSALSTVSDELSMVACLLLLSIPIFGSIFFGKLKNNAMKPYFDKRDEIERRYADEIEQISANGI